MFKILVADDEPTGLNHVCMILRKKCPQYDIVATAENGVQALRLVREMQPDVLITDIKMPVMDGIQLINAVKKDFPDILSVIVSGYSDFEYAQSAIKSGVCDYLLKPLVPADMQNLMVRLEEKLEKQYYSKRNEILRALCNGQEPDDKSQLTKYFPAGHYHAAIFRQNGLPRRFLKSNGVEIFSTEDEQFFVYGRDEKESLYLYPAKLLLGGNFTGIAERIFEKEQQKGTYVTGVVCSRAFTLEKLPEIAGRLYRKLDESIVIGESHLVNDTEKKDRSETGQDKKQLEHIEYLIRYKESSKLLKEIHSLFTVWKEERSSQLRVEADIKYMFRMLQNAYLNGRDLPETDFLIDDVFYNVQTMEELEESIKELVRQYIPEAESENLGNREQLFASILTYLNTHISEAVSLGDVCRKFGVSQTSLSRMFRTYKETSFSNYLTEIRIERAKEIMKNAPDSYVKDIAERCGYGDQFYFSRIFRSVTGVCPKEYMEKVCGLKNEK